MQKEYNSKLSQEIIDNIVEKMLQIELSSGVQTIEYQINTLITTSGQSPHVRISLSLDEENEYIEENAKIIEEILKQRAEGIKNEDGTYETPEFPKLEYILYEHNCLKGGKYDYLTKLALKCGNINYISAKKGNENNEGKFNQGIVSINLPQIAIIANKNEGKFWDLLDERLEICYEALMCRHYALLGIKAQTSPIHWIYGGVARLKKEETIDKLLKGEHSTIFLGYVGVYETTKLVKGTSHTTKDGEIFALKVLNHLKEIINKWKKETGISFMLYGISEENICKRFAKIDKEKYGNIEDITDKEYYTETYHIDVREKIDILEKLKIESKFQKTSERGISDIEISENDNIEEIIKFIYDNMLHVEIKKA